MKAQIKVDWAKTTCKTKWSIWRKTYIYLDEIVIKENENFEFSVTEKRVYLTPDTIKRNGYYREIKYTVPVIPLWFREAFLAAENRL